MTELKRKFYVYKNREPFPDICAIQVQEYTRETDKYWIIEGRRSPTRVFKDTAIKAYFDSWEDAHKYLVHKSAQRWDYLTNALNNYAETHKRIECMQRPTYIWEK